MGVPKFYRWISERYPCLSEVVKDYQIPEFNNLYLDMNGIIHICSHPNDDDPHFRISEEDIFKDIFHYIEVLFRMIQPSKVFYMAVDGVAPRAKMNQQRGRRFRTAREAEENERKALAKGEVLPSEARFDSNCITPGTAFMTKLDAQLEYFITSKVSNDKLWQNCSIIYSGHKTPGEGEHKIMEYIRYSKSQPDYDPNTRHCLYGLDADLIMLGLTSHEPYFSLLREEVRFCRGKTGNKRNSTPEETTFHLLHLSLMREYIEYEFYSLRDTISFKFDLEAIIDDWVLMGFLVGNDFIPHLPGLHINKDALLVLYETYKEVLPTLDGYLNEGGTLNLKRLEKFMAKLTEYDIEKFQELNADLKYLRAKRGGGVEEEVNTRMETMEKFAFDDDLADEAFGLLEEDNTPLSSREVRERLARLDIQPDDFLDDDEDEDSLEGDEAQFNAEFRQHKRHYYQTKMLFEEVDSEMLRDQATQYVRGLQWILHYYYNGICSWSWFYPHHYAPYISDVKDFGDLELTFEKGTPFLPFEQLLAVLPPLSVKLLPKPYWKLMLSDGSPLKEYYPRDFTTDLNGKQQDWEAVVCIPFINEKKLLEAMKECNEELDPEEKSRNSHGPMRIYRYTRENLGIYEAPDFFPAIGANHASVKLVWRHDWDIEPSKLVKGLLPGLVRDVYFAGFPTFKHLDHTFRKESAGVKVFQMASRGENFILIVTKHEPPHVKELVQKVLGHSVYIGWPHLVEMKVTCLHFENCRYFIRDDDPNPRFEEVHGSDKNFWQAATADVEKRLLNRWGIDVGETECILYGKELSGRNYAFGPNGKVILEKMWSETETSFPLQAIVRNLTIHDPSHKQYDSIENYFEPGTSVFMLGQSYYGAMGEVVGIKGANKEAVEVNFTFNEEPDLSNVISSFYRNSERYMSAGECSSKLSIGPQLFARLTGSIFLGKALELNPFSERDSGSGRLNIGLNLKNNRKEEEVVGFTRKTDGNKRWEYSMECLKSLAEYQRLFPEVFEFLQVNSSTNDVFEDEVFPTTYKERVQELTKWLKESPFSSAERCKWGSMFLTESTVREICGIVGKIEDKDCESFTINVSPSHLFKPNNRLQGSVPPDPRVTFNLFDRVVNVREGFSVPLGARGTVIGVHPADRNADKMYVVLFDKPFGGGLTLSGEASANRCYKLNWASMINISHGLRALDRNRYFNPSRNAPRYGDSPQNLSNQSNSSERKKFEQPPDVPKNGGNVNVIRSSPKEDVNNGSPQPPNPNLLPKPFSSLKGPSDNNLRQAQGESKASQSPHSNGAFVTKKFEKSNVSHGRGLSKTQPQPCQTFGSIWSQVQQTTGVLPGDRLQPRFMGSASAPVNRMRKGPFPSKAEDSSALERKEVSVTELFQIASRHNPRNPAPAPSPEIPAHLRSPPTHSSPMNPQPNFQNFLSNHQLYNRPPSRNYNSGQGTRCPPHSNHFARHAPNHPNFKSFGAHHDLPQGKEQPNHRTSYNMDAPMNRLNESPSQARFVPMQVARRRGASHKSSDPNDSVSTSNKESRQKSHSDHQAPSQRALNNSGGVPSKNKPKKKQRNRIAANFGPGQQCQQQQNRSRQDNG